VKAARAGGPMMCALLSLIALFPARAPAQQGPTQPGWPRPVEDRRIFAFGLLDQAEIRVGDALPAYRWKAEGWYGGDLNRLWLRTEGLVIPGTGETDEPEVQALYSRAATAYFDLQAGVRYDFHPSRPWLAVGVEGLAPMYFEIGAFGFVSTEGRYAARLEASYDMRLTQHLILQPQAELNLYAQSEPSVGRGHSEGDWGLRLRYELQREVAPYIGYVRATGVGGMLVTGLRLWR